MVSILERVGSEMLRIFGVEYDVLEALTFQSCDRPLAIVGHVINSL